MSCAPIDDGYWTPWHKAAGEIERLRRALAEIGVTPEEARAGAERSKAKDDEIERLRDENSALRVALDPRLWGLAHHAAWHGELPDTHDAFIALRKVALTPNA